MFLAVSFLIASTIGVVAHLAVFIRGEWHLRASKVLVFHALLGGLLILAKARYPATSQKPSLEVLVIILGYLSGLFGSITAYRVSPWHRLYSFPGPRVAVVSKLWHVWQCRDSRNHELMAKLHDEYSGDFIRIGPSELASFHPESFIALEGYHTESRKSDFYDLVLPDHTLAFTRDKQVHDKRRAVWLRALNKKAVASYQNRINRQVTSLLSVISQSSATGKPIVVNEIMYWFAWDSMGEFAFNESFGMLKEQQWHFVVRLFRRALSLVGIFSSAMWLIRIGFDLLPWFWKIGDWFAMMNFCEQQMTKRMRIVPEEEDVSSYFLAQTKSEVFQSVDMKWLKGDTATVIIAGSDTIAPTLTFLCYCLAKHPQHAEKVYREAIGIDPWDIDAIATLPHLNGFINETMRLYAITPTAVSRETPPQGIMIGDKFIPGKVKVLAPRWVIYKLESCFTHAHDFIPERWYSKPELIKQRGAFAPFGMGRTACVGQTLSITLIRLVLASLVTKFQLSFLPGEDGTELLKDMRDQLSAQPGKLTLRFELRD